MDDLFKNIVFDAPLAQAIVNTVHEPILVLGQDLRVIAASRSFFNFEADYKDIIGRIYSTYLIANSIFPAKAWQIL